MESLPRIEDMSLSGTTGPYKSMPSPAIRTIQRYPYSLQNGMHYPMANQRYQEPSWYEIHPQAMQGRAPSISHPVSCGCDGCRRVFVHGFSPHSGNQPQFAVYVMPAHTQKYHIHQQSFQESLREIPPLRGPPRKPKQSGHALWVGNLPNTANVSDLKDHFSQGATMTIESVFLMSRSNCAFVNYTTEASCVDAVSRFQGSWFGGVKLACRLKEGTSNIPSITDSPGILSEDDVPLSRASLSPTRNQSTKPELDEAVTECETVIACGSESETLSSPIESLNGSVSSSGSSKRRPERFFVLKSLTLLDLNASVASGTWATQLHNEHTLNQAFASSDNVYLIFSANRSGEYFGYARMASPITRDPTQGEAAPKPGIDRASNTQINAPRSIVTLATATTPKGRIIDDSARGIIFWEADYSEVGEEDGSKGEKMRSQSQEQAAQFKVDWISTTRLPFCYTRGLRNPWNANREVKIARDGTELESGVARRLLGMFHRPMHPK